MGYWPSVRSRWLDIGQVLFLRVYGPETKSRSMNSQKRTRLTFSHLDRTNLVNKGFITWLSGKFFLQDTVGSPERARWLHLARSGSQSQRAVWFILPTHGASHIINVCPDFEQNNFPTVSPLHRLKGWWILNAKLCKKAVFITSPRHFDFFNCKTKTSKCFKYELKTFRF